MNTSINKPLNLNKISAKKLSPFYNDLYISNANIKICIIVAENDSPAFKQQAELFNAKLKKLNINTEYVTINSVDHFSIMERICSKNYELTDYIIGKILQ